MGGVKNHQGIKPTGNQEEVDCLLELFQAVYKQEQGVQGQTASPVRLVVEMPDGAITEKEVWESLKNGDASKTVFLARIHTANWFTSTVIAVHEGGDRENCGSYSQVTVTFIELKTLEEALHDRMASRLEANKLMMTKQHDFWHKRPCLKKRIRNLDEVVGSNVDFCVKFIAFQKTFLRVKVEIGTKKEIKPITSKNVKILINY